MNKVNCITINTDASFCPKTKAAGYAFYIVCDTFKIKKGGMFKSEVENATDAETMCIANAIATVLAQGELPSSKWLIINTDSKNSIHQICTKSTALGKTGAKLHRRLINRLGSKKNHFRHEGAGEAHHIHHPYHEPG